MLFLTTIDPSNIKREFNCGFTSMEANFDFLSSIVAEGNTLVDAYILEGSSRMELPVAAFDGVPLSEVIRALQQEWEAVLSQPLQPLSAHRPELIEAT